MRQRTLPTNVLIQGIFPQCINVWYGFVCPSPQLEISLSFRHKPSVSDRQGLEICDPGSFCSAMHCDSVKSETVQTTKTVK